MTISSDVELAGLRRVGGAVARTLDAMRAAARPDLSTAALDDVGAATARALGARSAPQVTYGFPGFTCISVNEEIVHGVPGPRRLQPGDVVKLDVSLELDGFFADAAITVLVPPASAEAVRMQRCARRALNQALDAARAGVRVQELGRAVERTVRRDGFAITRELGGHGVGRALHEAPSVPNYADPTASTVLRDGLVLAVEPMVLARPARVVQEHDGWTLRTDNRALAVHHEHTIVVRRGHPLVVTQLAA